MKKTRIHPKINGSAKVRNFELKNEDEEGGDAKASSTDETRFRAEISPSSTARISNGYFGMGSKQKFIPIIHILVMILAYSTPWLIPWQFVVLIYILYLCQLLALKQCIFTRAEFGKNGETFVHHYLAKIWPNISKKGVNFAVDYVIPIGLIITAIIIQN